jgi:NADH-quinone oxidoreductase subunit J
VVFLLLAALTVAFALVVIVHRSPVYSALGLVGMMGLLSLFFVGLDAHMLAALQLIVYSGAIIVLVLFVIMLLNLEADRQITRGPAAVAVASVGGGLLAAVLVAATRRFAGAPMTALDPAFVDPTTLAARLFTTHLLPFELTSVLLLVAIVGAVVLGKRER